MNEVKKSVDEFIATHINYSKSADEFLKIFYGTNIKFDGYAWFLDLRESNWSLKEIDGVDVLNYWDAGDSDKYEYNYAHLHEPSKDGIYLCSVTGEDGVGHGYCILSVSKKFKPK